MEKIYAEIIEILNKDCRITPEQIAVMLDTDAAAVAAAIHNLEKDNVILGYKPLINWEKTMREYVTAFIELRITPQKNLGFDKIAEQICSYDEVQTAYLMSGSYDLAVILEGRTLKDVSLFVSEKLSQLDGVISTATHFVLKKYKDEGVNFAPKKPDERRVIG